MDFMGDKSRKAADMPNFLKVGRYYYGPNDERLLVSAIERGHAVVMHPISGVSSTRTFDEMTKFVAGSGRRTYRRTDTGEIRTKTSSDDDTVTYTDPHYRRHTVPRADWDDWRNHGLIES